MGGPMMGFAVLDLDTPVTKGTSGILALSQKELHAARETPCVACGGCVLVCPLGLNPTRLYKLVDHMEYNQAVDEGLMDCKECGCCSYTCPAHIPLVQGMRLGKRIYLKNRKKVKA
jgi:electron transport complex protein RnfC